MARLAVAGDSRGHRRDARQRTTIAGAHPVWELVLHMTAWKNETARRLAGAVACMPIEGDWPEVGDPTDQRWHEALARLKSAHAKLIAAVKALPEKKLYEPTNDTRSAPLGTGVSVLRPPPRHRPARRLPRWPDCDSEEGTRRQGEEIRPRPHDQSSGRRPTQASPSRNRLSARASR